ncbi:hypothetical protein ACFLUA_01215 [Chloroflexota bacterium]
MFLQTPTPEPNIFQQIDWGVATPIFTFILGAIITFLVTFLKDYLDRRREIKNMETAILSELAYNHSILKLLVERSKQGEGFLTTMMVVNTISLSVFESYANSIGALKKEVLESVFIAYRYLFIIFHVKETLLIMSKDEDVDADQIVESNSIIGDWAQSTIPEIETAMQMFKEGKDYL